MTVTTIPELLDVRELAVAIHGADGTSTLAVERVDLRVAAGEIVALVGESGCGKSLTALAISGLLPEGEASIARGSVSLEGDDLVGLRAHRMEDVRGARIGAVFQDPFHSLNPSMTVARQIAEPLRRHLGMDRSARRARVLELLASVGISAPERVAAAYPHQLSGGMQQRVGIAIGLSCEPSLLVADEPTTALDVTIQRQIMELLAARVRAEGVGMLIVTHDMGVVAALAHRVYVMYSGRIVESAPTRTLFREPHHPYTRALLASVPRLDTPVDQPLLPIGGEPPLPARRPPGCAFSPRCPDVVEACRSAVPALDGGDHPAACFVPAGGAPSAPEVDPVAAHPRSDSRGGRR